MTVLVGKAVADLISKWRGLSRQGHGAEHTAETLKRVVSRDGASLEQIFAVLTGDDD
jgi:hypothetical protein